MVTKLPNLNTTRQPQAKYSERKRTAIFDDLARCPATIAPLDPNAEKLWLMFLRKVGIPFARNGKSVLEGDGSAESETKRAWVIRNFGMPSLVQRLPHAKDEVSRARIWWRESVACDAGESIPDLSSENLHVLNAFIVTKTLKFKDTRFERIAERRKERKQMERFSAALGVRYCANTTFGSRHLLPATARANALFCDQACKRAAYRVRASG